jgi:hypothetical protein
LLCHLFHFYLSITAVPCGHLRCIVWCDWTVFVCCVVTRNPAGTQYYPVIVIFLSPSVQRGRSCRYLAFVVEVSPSLRPHSWLVVQ